MLTPNCIRHHCTVSTYMALRSWSTTILLFFNVFFPDTSLSIHALSLHYCHLLPQEQAYHGSATFPTVQPARRLPQQPTRTMASAASAAHAWARASSTARSASASTVHLVANTHARRHVSTNSAAVWSTSTNAAYATSTGPTRPRPISSSAAQPGANVSGPATHCPASTGSAPRSCTPGPASAS